MAVHSPIMEISSKKKKKRFKEGRTIKYLVPEGVIEYIKDNHLYKE